MQTSEDPQLLLMQDLQFALITQLDCSVGALNKLKQGDFPLGP